MSDPNTDDLIIRAEGLRKEYRMGDSIVHALDGVDLTICRGEFISITGASGSGKSTLMHILGCLDRPTAGVLELNGRRVSTMTEKQLADVRNRSIGFVFQTFNLINRTSALDNVLVPLMYTRRRFSKAAARSALEKVGLLQRAGHTPSEMSGGECQRVAIARAIVNNPVMILADEPTGNLDSRTTEQIMALFHQLHTEGITIILVTHETEIAMQAKRTIHMRDGKIVEDHIVDDQRRGEILDKTYDAHKKRMSHDRPTKETAAPVRLVRGTGTEI